MEGKKITTSILPLAIDLREIERWRSKEQGKLKRTLGMGWDFLFSRKLQEEEEREKTPHYIEKGYGSHNLKVQLSSNIVLRASDGFDEEGRIDRRNIYFPKSIYFTSFEYIENSVQILYKKTVLPLSLAK